METYKTRSQDWTRDLSFNCYVPVSVDDVYHLDTYTEMLRLHDRQMKPGAVAGKHTLFFGNHPLRFVQVAGYVSNAEYPLAGSSFRLSKFSIHDGTCDSSLECVSKSHKFAAAQPVSSRSLVCVWGQLMSFDSVQVEVHRVFVLDCSESAKYYMLRQQALLVRKHVLEWPAEMFEYFAKPLPAGTYPRTSLIDHAEEIDLLWTDLQRSATIMGVPSVLSGATVWP